MLIVETADMLQAPLFTAEALLRAHGTLKLFYIQLVTHAQYLYVLQIVNISCSRRPGGIPALTFGPWCPIYSLLFLAHFRCFHLRKKEIKF